MPRASWAAKASLLLAVAVLAGCAATADTRQALQARSGVLVEGEQRAGARASDLRVAGASWLDGGRADAEFQRRAQELAWSMGCKQYRIEGRRESQESTVLGTRRVIEGRVVCS